MVVSSQAMGIAQPKAKRSHHAKPRLIERDEKSKSITDFFKPPPPPPQVGRPAGLPVKKRGPRPPAASVDVCPEAPTPLCDPPASTTPSGAANGKRAAAALLGVTLQRINWGKGERLQLLTAAVRDWDAKTGTILEGEQTIPLKRYAALVNIPYTTLLKYTNPELDKRATLGTSVGKPPLFKAEEQQFAVDVIRRHDRGNDGLCKRECVDKLHDMRPELKRRDISNAFDRTIRPQHEDELTGIIKANPTTVKRTAITVAQQFRWHTAVEQAIIPYQSHTIHTIS